MRQKPVARVVILFCFEFVEISRIEEWQATLVQIYVCIRRIFSGVSLTVSHTKPVKVHKSRKVQIASIAWFGKEPTGVRPSQLQCGHNYKYERFHPTEQRIFPQRLTGRRRQTASGWLHSPEGLIVKLPVSWLRAAPSPISERQQR